MQLASIEVKVDLLEGSQNQQEINEPNGESTKREQFWAYLRATSGYGVADVKEKTTRQLEVMLEQKFGLELHALLVKHFLINYSSEHGGQTLRNTSGKLRGDAQQEQDYARLLPRILFKARIRRYSSLVFGVDISSLEFLAKLFDGSYEAFEFFLDQYIPEAFLATFGEWEGSAEYTLKPDSTIRKTFNSLQAQNNQRQSLPSLALRRAEWMWILANTSLVVPSFAALLGAFLLIYSVDKQQDRLDQRLIHLLEQDEAHQKVMATTYNELLKGYRELLDRPSGK